MLVFFICPLLSKLSLRPALYLHSIYLKTAAYVRGGGNHSFGGNFLLAKLNLRVDGNRGIHHHHRHSVLSFHTY